MVVNGMAWREYIVKIQDDGKIIADDIPDGPPELIRCRDCRLRWTLACTAPLQARNDDRFYCRDGEREGELKW